ncbi:hypothetical protein MRX96_024549 [Rhipicephalus microplus]
MYAATNAGGSFPDGFIPLTHIIEDEFIGGYKECWISGWAPYRLAPHSNNTNVLGMVRFTMLTTNFVLTGWKEALVEPILKPRKTATELSLLPPSISPGLQEQTWKPWDIDTFAGLPPQPTHSLLNRADFAQGTVHATHWPT